MGPSTKLTRRKVREPLPRLELDERPAPLADAESDRFPSCQPTSDLTVDAQHLNRPAADVRLVFGSQGSTLPKLNFGDV